MLFSAQMQMKELHIQGGAIKIIAFGGMTLFYCSVICNILAHQHSNTGPVMTPSIADALLISRRMVS